MPGELDCSLEAQTAAWRLRLQFGGADCRLEARIAGWRLGLQRGRLARWPFGARGCHLEFHTWPFAAPGDNLELQNAI